MFPITINQKKTKMIQHQRNHQSLNAKPVDTKKLVLKMDVKLLERFAIYVTNKITFRNLLTVNYQEI